MITVKIMMKKTSLSNPNDKNVMDVVNAKYSLVRMINTNNTFDIFLDFFIPSPPSL